MMQTTLSPNLVVYASMTNQSPENNLTPRIKVTLTRTGILDYRGKPLLQKLEQITLNDIEIDNLRKFFTFLDYFHLYNVQTPGISPVNSVVQSQPGRDARETRQIHLHDHQLPAELKELVKTDNVEEIHLVQATIRVAAHFVVKFKSNCNHNKFKKYEFFFIERGVDLPVELK